MSEHSGNTHDHFAQLGPAPCDDCPMAQWCASELLACRAFQLYATLRPWRNAMRLASHERYLAIYNCDERCDAELAAVREAQRRSRKVSGRRPGRKSMEATTSC